MRKIIVDQDIFDRFPDFKRGLIIVSDVKNAASNPTIEQMLNTEIERKAGSNDVAHEYVKAWDEVYAKLGVNPNKFPPSIKSLLKRVAKSGGFPFINSIVALFNYVSIKYLIPCGGDDTNRIEGNLRLGLSRGNETFIPLGTEAMETPIAGEVIYFDDKSLTVMCRRWNWRNGDATRIDEPTSRLVINIDGVGPVPLSVITEARDELAGLLKGQCGASLKTDLIDKQKMEVEIDI
jgi:DNA/RNA-binding domain of Phe-tRNA-synthetase-like protein